MTKNNVPLQPKDTHPGDSMSPWQHVINYQLVTCHMFGAYGVEKWRSAISRHVPHIPPKCVNVSWSVLRGKCVGLYVSLFSPHYIWTRVGSVLWLTPSCATSFKENEYLLEFSFVNAHYPQVLEILPRERRVSIHPVQLISRLLVTWRCKEPSHQQPYYWRNYPQIIRFHMRR